jgi:hypothetical protein
MKGKSLSAQKGKLSDATLSCCWKHHIFSVLMTNIIYYSHFVTLWDCNCGFLVRKKFLEFYLHLIRMIFTFVQTG